jgi:DivIVA domain-containing protein
MQEITPRELRDVEIRNEMRGYHRDEVNELLDRAAGTIESLSERIQQMTERLGSAQAEAGRTRETEDVLHRTLLLAQRAADEAVAEATAKARQMLDDADIQSRRLVADAEADARRKGEAERRRLEEEILELASRRDALLADVEALTRFEAEYRERMVRALEADLFALRSRPTTAPGARPEPTDVERSPMQRPRRHRHRRRHPHPHPHPRSTKVPRRTKSTCARCSNKPRPRR